MLTKKLIKDNKKRLLKLKKELTKELGAVIKQERVDLGPDQEDEATELMLYGNVLPIERNLEERLELVNKALARIKNKTYGLCPNCQQEISVKRLQALPEAGSCIKCQQKRQS